MEYTCYYCQKKVTLEDIKRRVRCPYCGSKVLFKDRLEVGKIVKAR